MASGRYSTCNAQVLKESEEYLESCVDIEEQELTGLSAKGTELYKTKLRVRLPSIEGLALYLDVTRKTLYNWAEENEAFLHILERLRAKQASVLLEKGLSGDYNSTIAKVILTKHGYREGIEQTGEGGKPLISDKLTDEDKELLQILNEHERNKRAETKKTSGVSPDTLDSEA